MIGQMAIARALLGFNDLVRSVTSFSFDESFSLLIFFFREKMKKTYRLEVRVFGKMHHRVPFLSDLRACVRWFQIPLKGLNFVKTLVTFGIIYATDPLLDLLQNMTKIICLR